MLRERAVNVPAAAVPLDPAVGPLLPEALAVPAEPNHATVPGSESLASEGISEVLPMDA